MPRRNSIAIALAVTVAVIAATAAMVTNASLVQNAGADEVTDTEMPTTTTASPSTTAPAEPVVVYEYIDVPVTVPPAEVIYVPVEVPSAPAPPTTNPPPPPTTVAPMELLEFDMYGFVDIVVASHGSGDRLQFWAIEQQSPWVWEIEEDEGPIVEVEFFNPVTEKEAEFRLEIVGDGQKLKMEGSGFEDVERYL